MSKKEFEIMNKAINFAIEHPDLAPDRVIVISGSKRSIDKILTKSRLEIIRVIKKVKPDSVTKLCKLVKRPVESVSRDLRILKFYGLLEFTKNGKQKIPKIEKDAIIIPLRA